MMRWEVGVRPAARMLGAVGEIRAWRQRWLHPASALIVPVVAAEPVLTAWAGHPLMFGGARPHVTVMYPFLPPHRIDSAVRREIVELAARRSSFSFSLTHVDQFPGVYYLAPQPTAPFVELTADIQARWPECQPYGGAFDEVRPHVTIGFGDHPVADLAGLEVQLPIALQATELWLLEQSARGWRTRGRFLLGTRG